MKTLLMSAAAAASLILSGCTTDPVYNNHVAGGFAAGAVIGGSLGAIAGSAIPGLGTAAGAALGAAAGGTIGVVVADHHYYRSTHGYCYWIDPHGRPHYNYHVRC